LRVGPLESQALNHSFSPFPLTHCNQSRSTNVSRGLDTDSKLLTKRLGQQQKQQKWTEWSDGRTDGQTDIRTNGQTDRVTDGHKDQRTVGHLGKHSVRLARTPGKPKSSLCVFVWGSNVKFDKL